MKKTLILHSPMSPLEAAGALRRSMDEERRTLFSLSGFKGDQDVIGSVYGNSIHMQKRRYWRNDFAPHFYGSLQPDPGGTRIEGHFGTAEWVRNFMVLWLLGVLGLGGSFFVVCLRDILTGSHVVEGDARVGLIVPPAMFLFGLALPRFGRWLGQSEETFLLQHLQNVLRAHIEEPPASPTPAIHPQ